MNKKEQPVFKLSDRILTNIDLARAIRQTKQLDDYFHQNNLRGGGQPTAISKAGRVVEDLARDNNLSILEKKDRKLLLKQLAVIQEHAPVVHFSFPSEPSRGALANIVGWLRNNVNFYCLVSVGLEPIIGIGCIVRTENKIFDCSLKNRLNGNKDLLKQVIQKATKS
ncbi:hypothetical protein A3F37_01765 [Candidatus Saccharibacteria bacterium RIFCSPHIGHO2_12_FULL_41_12]|nr:MAG: hypothetical protein A3F37_01765 [Candidatus Saccharibacteria bacterium RIFCSPHIGHO2_12_FULL_41_12]